MTAITLKNISFSGSSQSAMYSLEAENNVRTLTFYLFNAHAESILTEGLSENRSLYLAFWTYDGSEP